MNWLSVPELLYTFLLAPTHLSQRPPILKSCHGMILHLFHKSTPLNGLLAGGQSEKSMQPCHDMIRNMGVWRNIVPPPPFLILPSKVLGQYNITKPHAANPLSKYTQNYQYHH